MKTKSILKSPEQFNPDLENLMRKKHIEQKESARISAKHFALTNKPALKDDNINTYIGVHKAEYEKLSAEIQNELQSLSQFPKTKIDIDSATEREQTIDSEIVLIIKQIQNIEFELSNNNPMIIPLKLWMAVSASILIFIGEVIYNAKTFQLFVENLLFALILSIVISFGISASSHATAFLYKDAKTRRNKILVIFISLVFMISLFIGLALIRTKYFANHDIDLNPLYFIIINLFLFIISGIMSYALLPSWSEMKSEYSNIKLRRELTKSKKQLITLQTEKYNLRKTIDIKKKQCLDVAFYSNYLTDLVRKMYAETVAFWKNINHIHRPDQTAPDCYEDDVKSLNIEDVMFKYINQNKK